MNKKIRITGTGCALADFVYDGIDFNSPYFQKYVSRIEGDGGLSPGKLVFTEELEKFAGKLYPEIIAEITNGKNAESFTIGGPSLVSLIHASQMLPKNEFEIEFYGVSGNDGTSRKIRQLLHKTPVGFSNYKEKSKKPTPFTHVLSDPNFCNGNGERTFINNIGAAWDLTPDELPDEFFKSDIVCFGGTALTPNIHDNLHFLLGKAKTNNAITVVNTVYDFKNQKQKPDDPWPLGITELSFKNIDILVMDNEEATKISGFSNIDDVLDYFSQKTSALVITRGSNTILFRSNGKIFEKDEGELPVSQKVSLNILKKQYIGDTTGCGDNFVGGVITSIAEQIQNKNVKFNLRNAIISGICAGGFTCSYYGGTYFERDAGEKKKKIDLLIQAYKNQE